MERGLEKDISVSAHVWKNAATDALLFELVDELSAARYELKAASTRLSKAERRLAGQALHDAKEPLPAWYEMAECAENTASALIRRIFGQITEVRAHTKAGLAIKLLILSEILAEDVEPAAELFSQANIGAKLVTSILRDIGGAPVQQCLQCHGKRLVQRDKKVRSEGELLMALIEEQESSD